MDYVVFIILAPLAALVLAGAARHVWPYRTVPGGSAFLWLGGIAIWWLLTNSLEVVSSTFDAKLFWARTTYLAIVTMPLAWVAFALGISGRHERVRSVPFWLLTIIPILTIAAVYTNDIHGLIWEQVEYLERPPFDGLRVWYGPWFWFMVVYSYGLVGLGSLLILYTYFKFGPLYRAQARWLAIGALFPLAFNVIHIFKLIPWLDKDPSPLGFAAAAAFFWLGMRRLRIFDVRPVAHTQLLRQMTDGMLVVDRQGQIVEANEAVQHLFMAHQTSVMGEPFEKVLLPAVTGRLEALDGTGAMRKEALVIRKDGQTYHYQIEPSILRDQRGELTGRLFLFHDVTALQEAAEALREANQELHTRNEELDAFAHTVAHDLKNPVHALQGAAQILTEDYARMSEADREEFIGLIGQMGVKMQNIIEALMLLSGVRKMPVSLAPVNIGQCAAEALERLQLQVQEREATVVLPASWSDALGYAPWVEEVWVNYISNALKYGGERPHITLGVTPEADGHIRFWVRDHGLGIEQRAQSNLFVPFTRLHQTKEEGHGLGLAIVRRIMEKLGGRFGVESSGRPGEGSLFYFTLPAVAPDADRPVTSVQQEAVLT